MADIEYNEELHQYKIDGKIVPSVTELAKRFSGMNTDWLEKHPEFAERGTVMHNQLAEYYKNGTFPTDKKAIDIIAMIPETESQQVEVLVYNKTLEYAGTVDMLVMDGKKCRCLIDFKSGENGNKRYYHCQLSLYLLALKDMGVDTSETKMFIVTPQTGATAFEPLSWEEMQSLCEDLLSKADPESNDVKRIEFLEEQIGVLAPYVQKYNDFTRELKEKLSAVFNTTGTKQYTGAYFHFSMIPESTRKTFDTTKAKLLLGDKAKECEKETVVAGTIRMTELKKEN